MTGEARHNGDNGWKLPRGRHRIPRDLVHGHQRERLLAAAAAALAEQGYSRLTVRHVIERAGVSRATFYEHFEDKHDCVAAAHGWAFDRLSCAIFSACASRRDWADGVAAAIGAALEFAAASPPVALLLIAHAAVVDPRLTERIVASHDHLAGMLRAGRERCPEAAALQDLTEQALLGAAMSVIGNQLIAGQASDLPQMGPRTGPADPDAIPGR
jgi:AcrR family transcriptional regulator